MYNACIFLTTAYPLSSLFYMLENPQCLVITVLECFLLKRQANVKINTYIFGFLLVKVSIISLSLKISLETS